MLTGIGCLSPYLANNLDNPELQLLQGSHRSNSFRFCAWRTSLMMRLACGPCKQLRPPQCLHLEAFLGAPRTYDVNSTTLAQGPVRSPYREPCG